MSLQEITKIKGLAEDLRRRADRAAGALERAMLEVREEYGCESVEEIKDLLKELDIEIKDAQDKFDKAYSSFLEKWGGELKNAGYDV